MEGRGIVDCLPPLANCSLPCILCAPTKPQNPTEEESCWSSVCDDSVMHNPYLYLIRERDSSNNMQPNNLSFLFILFRAQPGWSRARLADSPCFLVRLSVGSSAHLSIRIHPPCIHLPFGLPISPSAVDVWNSCRDASAQRRVAKRRYHAPIVMPVDGYAWMRVPGVPMWSPAAPANCIYGFLQGESGGGIDVRNSDWHLSLVIGHSLSHVGSHPASMSVSLSLPAKSESVPGSVHYL